MLHDQLKNTAHVWFARPERSTDRKRLECYRTMLSPNEAVQYRGFRFAEDRHRYLIAHALLRSTLSRYACLEPAEWTFAFGSHGRPEIDNPGTPPLRFNLTHTQGLVGCIVCLEDDCGIDAENCTSRHDLDGIAESIFSARQYHELQSLRGAARIDYFYSRWTLYEAYVKALGVGLSCPPSSICFEVSGSDHVSVLSAADADYTPEHWQFTLLRPTLGHVAAVSLRSDGQADRQLIVRTVDM